MKELTEEQKKQADDMKAKWLQLTGKLGEIQLQKDMLWKLEKETKDDLSKLSKEYKDLTGEE